MSADKAMPLRDQYKRGKPMSDYVCPAGTCRLCGGWREDTAKGPLIRYAVRHSAHADCALGKWGGAFFDRLQAWKLENFPALIAARYGLYDELGRRIAKARGEA